MLICWLLEKRPFLEFEHGFLAGSDTNCDNDRGFMRRFSLPAFVIKEFYAFRRLSLGLALLALLKFVKGERVAAFRVLLIITL